MIKKLIILAVGDSCLCWRIHCPRHSWWPYPYHSQQRLSTEIYHQALGAPENNKDNLIQIRRKKGKNPKELNNLCIPKYGKVFAHFWRTVNYSLLPFIVMRILTHKQFLKRLLFYGKVGEKRYSIIKLFLRLLLIKKELLKV